MSQKQKPGSSVKRDLAGKTLADLGRALGTQEGTWSRRVEQSWLRALADELIRDYPRPSKP